MATTPMRSSSLFLPLPQLVSVATRPPPPPRPVHCCIALTPDRNPQDPEPEPTADDAAVCEAEPAPSWASAQDALRLTPHELVLLDVIQSVQKRLLRHHIAPNAGADGLAGMAPEASSSSSAGGSRGSRGGKRGAPKLARLMVKDEAYAVALCRA